jgi:hypothetical protein
MARPREYKKELVDRARTYLKNCIDEETEFHKTRSHNSNTYERRVNVKIPTIEGLAVFIGISRSVLYKWIGEKDEEGNPLYPEFVDIIDELQEIQADRLLTNGLSGNYNSTIAKVLLTKHGYREGIDSTTNDKDLPQPLLNVLYNKCDKEDSETGEKD